MSKHRYFNSTDGQVVIDDDGHIIGGQETDEFEETTQVAKAVKMKLLIDLGEVEGEEEPVNPGTTELTEAGNEGQNTEESDSDQTTEVEVPTESDAETTEGVSTEVPSVPRKSAVQRNRATTKKRQER